MTGTTPAGQATNNATLEGLTISRDGREIVAAMEGALSGDASASGDATSHRFLAYEVDSRGTWRLTEQVAYRTDPGKAPSFGATQFTRVLNLTARLP